MGGDQMDVILPSKSRLIVPRMVFLKPAGQREKIGVFPAFHQVIYDSDIVPNQISLVF